MNYCVVQLPVINNCTHSWITALFSYQWLTTAYIRELLHCSVTSDLFNYCIVQLPVINNCTFTNYCIIQLPVINNCTHSWITALFSYQWFIFNILNARVVNTLWKESLNSDNQQFYHYHQNKHLSLEHKKTIIYDFGNPGPELVWDLVVNGLQIRYLINLYPQLQRFWNHCNPYY